MKQSCRGTRFLPRLLGRTSRPTCSSWRLGDTTDEPAPWRAVWSRSVMPGMVCRGGPQGYCVPPGICRQSPGCHAGRRGASDAARDAVGSVFPGLGCGVVGIVLRCPAPPRLKRGLLTMAAHRLWSGLASNGWRYQLQRRGPSLSATTSTLTFASWGPVPRSALPLAAWNGRLSSAGNAEHPYAGNARREDCELCGQPGSSPRLRVGHGAQPGSGAVRGRGRR